MSVKIGSHGNAAGDDLTVLICDSKQAGLSPMLEFTADEFAAFVAAVKKGAYDYLVQTEDDGEPATGAVQLLVPTGPIWEGMQNSLRGAGLEVKGPIPLDEDPIPTFILRPVNLWDSP